MKKTIRREEKMEKAEPPGRKTKKKLIRRGENMEKPDPAGRNNEDNRSVGKRT